MGTVTVFTADRMETIENESIVDANIVDGELILDQHDGSTLNAGAVTTSGLLTVQGDWDIGTAYSANTIVNHSGGTWINDVATTAGQEPGVHSAWKEFVVDVTGKLADTGGTMTGNLVIDIPDIVVNGFYGGLIIQSNSEPAGKIRLISTAFGPALQIFENKSDAEASGQIGGYYLQFGDGVAAPNWTMTYDPDTDQVQLDPNNHIRSQSDPINANDLARKSWIDKKTGIKAVNVVTDYGADPTGVANSRDAINDAISDLSDTGGGTVFFPAGTYLVNPGASNYGLLLKSNIRLVGEGYDTLIKSPNDDYCRLLSAYSAAVDNVEICNLRFDGGTESVSWGDPIVYMLGGDNWSIHDIWIHNANSQAMFFAADNAGVTNLKIRNVEIKDCYAQAIYIENELQTNSNIFISDVSVDGFGIDNISGRAAFQVMGDHIRIDNCSVKNPTPVDAVGFQLRGSNVTGNLGTGAMYSIISNCYAHMGATDDTGGNGAGAYGFEVEAATNGAEPVGIKLVGCVARNATHGYYIAGAGVEAHGCYSYDVAIGFNAVGNHIHLTGFTGNKIMTRGVQVIGDDGLFDSIFIAGDASNGWTPRGVRWDAASSGNVLGMRHGSNTHATFIDDQASGANTQLTIA